MMQSPTIDATMRTTSLLTENGYGTTDSQMEHKFQKYIKLCIEYDSLFPEHKTKLKIHIEFFRCCFPCTKFVGNDVRRPHTSARR